MKYRILIEEVNEYEETIKRFRSKLDPKKAIGSLYSIEEDDRQNYEEYQYPTGQKLQKSIKIFEQTVDDMDMAKVIKSINSIE